MPTHLTFLAFWFDYVIYYASQGNTGQNSH